MTALPDFGPCRFCSSPGVGVYHLPEGCVCHPGDRVQVLCAQHVVRATPVGDMTTLAGWDRRTETILWKE